MARPKKDTQISVKQRIEDAFWKLSEDKCIESVSIVELADAAECNRGTFYYYYRGVNKLIDGIVEKSLSKPAESEMVKKVTEMGAPEDIKTITFGDSEGIATLRELFARSSTAYALDSCHKCVVRMAAANMDKAVEELSESERVWFEFLAGGFVSMIKYRADEED